MWLNYIAMFICVGGAIFQFVMAAKYNNLMFAMLGSLCAAMAGLNYLLLDS
jgi:hypothetical protein